MRAMKATTFTPTGAAAVALLAPDAVVLTIGALINRILDNQTDPVFIVIDQIHGKLSVFPGGGDAETDISAAVTSSASELAMLFEPGALNPVPFEGA